MVRKLLRDYGLSERANIMEKQKKKAQVGFSNIIFASNNMRRPVLKGESPNSVATSILNNDPKISTRLTEHMQKHRKKQLLKNLFYKHNNFQLYKQIMTRLFIVYIYHKHNSQKKWIFVLV